MKKLVKTAKKQFEERLVGLRTLCTYEAMGANFYLCENANKEMSILHDSMGCGFVEYKYQGSYRNMIESEEFLYKIVVRFNEIKEPVKHIFDWYASADKGLTPFTVYDIWKCMDYLTSISFQDIYEEVSDVPGVRIVTAEEQWEKDSQRAEVIQKPTYSSTYKVAVTDGSITFFVHQDGEYFREVYPPFDELRKDAAFVTAYLSRVRSMHDTDMDAALFWLQGGEYTMSKASLLDIYEVGESIDHLCYHDEEEPVVVKQDFSNEVNELRKKMVAHIIELCERGMTIDENYFTEEFGGESIVFKNDTYIPFCELNSMFIGKNERGEWALFLKCTELTEYDLMDLSVGTLLRITSSLQQP